MRSKDVAAADHRTMPQNTAWKDTVPKMAADKQALINTPIVATNRARCPATARAQTTESGAREQALAMGT